MISKRRQSYRRLIKKMPKRIWRRLSTLMLLTLLVLLSSVVLAARPSKSPEEQVACTYMPTTSHSAANTSATTAKQIGQDIVTECFGSDQWIFAEELWTREASWRPLATNPTSGACGIVQAVPCSKLLNAVGKQTIEATTIEEQLQWGVNYIKSRYGTPQKALEFWKSRAPIQGKDVGNWY